MSGYTALAFREAPGMIAVGAKGKFDFKYPLDVGYLGLYAELARHR